MPHARCFVTGIHAARYVTLRIGPRTQTTRKFRFQWGRLTGKIKRGKVLADGRIKAGGSTGGPDVDENIFENVTEALEQVEKETGKSIPQIALNWLLGRETVSNIVIGARNEEQLVANLGALGWSLSEEHRSLLDKVSEQKKLYPHWVGMR